MGLRGPSDILWHSQPCTGGCPWQKYNMRKGESTREKIKDHYKLFRDIWKAFTEIAEIAIKRGAMVIIEWPKGCAYWNNMKVKNFLRKHEFDETFIDGCMYGLVASSGNEVGTPIRKPWRLAHRGLRFTPDLKTCDHSHSHTPCQGKNTKDTESYTDRMVQTIMKQFCKNHAMMKNQSKQTENQCL